MFRSIDLSYSEQRPDRSRYAYSVSASYFTPAQADVELDKAIEGFAAMGLNGLANITGQGGQYPYNNYHSNGGRIQEPPYPGSYAGSMADSYYTQGGIAPPMTPNQMQAIDYPRNAIPPPSSGGSRVSSSRSHHQRRSRHASSSYYSNFAPVDEQALVKYKRKKSKASGWDEGYDDGDVGPEDSISQVSSRMSEVSERRGRTRRRDGSVVSRSTVVPGRGQYSMGGGGGGSFVEPEFYYTRDITPW